MGTYQPTLTYSKDAECLEFIAEDIATVAHEVVPGFAVVLALGEDERRPVGFRLFIDPRALQEITAPNDGTTVQLPINRKQAEAMIIVGEAALKSFPV